MFGRRTRRRLDEQEAQLAERSADEQLRESRQRRKQAEQLGERLRRLRARNHFAEALRDALGGGDER